MLVDDIRELINRRSRESLSNTPDFILAAYIMDCLSAFEVATGRRDAWYGQTADKIRSGELTQIEREAE